ncbi:M91 family zinc metallopeptidase [Luteimonas sp. YGD11-2]|uniref:M91 family zinc metallopeptidase n=1 Tax=Luteimonas sp. YGD11-2 TaxID=2508168 RepID=UPI00100A8522|nr:M91 family zinc metallopeptidase [Luteimonas sp. YGD11-2]
MTHLDAASPAALQPTQGYWDGQQAQDATQNRFNDAPLRSTDAPAQVADRAVNVADTAIPIQGNDRGSSLPGLQTPDGKRITNSELHVGEQATVTREQTVADYGITSDQVVFTTSTGEGDDDVRISQRDDGTLDVEVNGESYAVRLTERQELTLRTGGGNDTITASPNVTVNLVIDAGAGDDVIRTGMGDDRIFGGDGNDTIETIGGRNDIDGGNGDDTLIGGNGDNIIFGGAGNDVIRAGSGFNFIEGGLGNDEIFGGAGQNILSGGRGDDVIHVDAAGRSSAYAGLGNDTINGAGANDLVYTEVGDLVNAATGARPTVVNVEIDTGAGQTIAVTGSEQFRQRVESELDFLRSSAAGTQMLSELDAAVENKGNRVTIQELANEQNGYAQTFGRGGAEIVNGRAGVGGDVTIGYNPSFHMDAFPAPTVVLYHEMSHAYNGVNGTFQPGSYTGSGPDRGIRNAERQAVGLETSAPAFDFDGDPSTPPTTHNPIHLTENGLRRELGMPDRPSYRL